MVIGSAMSTRLKPSKKICRRHESDNSERQTYWDELEKFCGDANGNGSVITVNVESMTVFASLEARHKESTNENRRTPSCRLNDDKTGTSA